VYVQTVKKISIKSFLVLLIATFTTLLVAVSPANANGQQVTLVGGPNFYATTTEVLRNGPTFTTSGFSATPTFSVDPELPNGLSMDTSTGAVTGTPTQAIAQSTFTVTATSGSETATVNFFLAVVQKISVTAPIDYIPASTLYAESITVTFGHGSMITSPTGAVGFGIQEATVANDITCASITLSVTATNGCSIDRFGSVTNFSFDGVDFSNPNAIFTVTVAPNTFTSPAAGYMSFNINLSNAFQTESLNSGFKVVRIGSAPTPAPQPPTPSGPVATLDFNLSVGQQVANAPIPYSASGLLPNSNYDITVRSTPQIIAQGTVPAGGTVSGSATIPDGLAPGWHTITFTTTAADGAETKDVVWFKIAGDGTLLATSDVQPAELALTPAPKPDSWYFAFLILLVGFGAFFVAREINPEFMRVMTLARNEKGEWEFTKRRIRSEEY